jgi:hypothetical protein
VGISSKMESKGTKEEYVAILESLGCYPTWENIEQSSDIFLTVKARK